MLVADLVRRRAACLWLLAVAGGRRFMPPVLAFVSVMAFYGHSRAGKTGCSYVNRSQWIPLRVHL